jgi:hypothetical protein
MTELANKAVTPSDRPGFSLPFIRQFGSLFVLCAYGGSILALGGKRDRNGL